MKRFFADTITVEPIGIETTPEGFLIVPARFTRSGVFKYEYGNVFRSAWEVGRDSSVKSLIGKSVTDLHPAGDTFVDPKNWKELEVGTVISAWFDWETEILSGKVIIKEKRVIDRILLAKEKGESIELSCGYESNLIEYKEAKTDPKTNEVYYFEATDIIYNHVALVPKGRAGANIKLMLDSLNNKEELMKLKIKEKNANGKKFLDAMEITVEDNSAEGVERLERAIDSACGEIEGLNAQLEAEKTKSKDAMEQLETIKKTHIDSKDVESLVDKKINLKRVCDGLNIDSANKSMTQMEDEIIKVAMPKISLDGKNEDYRKAILDSSMVIAEEMVKNNKKVKDGFIPESGNTTEKGLWDK